MKESAVASAITATFVHCAPARSISPRMRREDEPADATHIETGHLLRKGGVMTRTAWRYGKYALSTLTSVMFIWFPQ